MIVVCSVRGVVLRSVQPASICAAQPQTTGAAHHGETPLTTLTVTIAGAGAQQPCVVCCRLDHRRRRRGGHGAEWVRPEHLYSFRRCRHIRRIRCGPEIEQRCAHDPLQCPDVGNCSTLAVTMPQHQPRHAIGIAVGERINDGTLQLSAICRTQHRWRRVGALACRRRRASERCGSQSSARLIGKHRIAVSANATMDLCLGKDREHCHGADQKEQCKDLAHPVSIEVTAAPPQRPRR